MRSVLWVGQEYMGGTVSAGEDEQHEHRAVQGGCMSGDLSQYLVTFSASISTDFTGKLAGKVANRDHVTAGLCNQL